jgi:hypothetical protein
LGDSTEIQIHNKHVKYRRKEKEEKENPVHNDRLQIPQVRGKAAAISLSLSLSLSLALSLSGSQ